MRWPTLVQAFLAMATGAPHKMASPLNLRIITSNIRYAADPSTYEKPWSVRGPLLINTISNTANAAIKAKAVPIIGMQEVLHDQLLDILTGLGSEWEHLGTGRDDGKEDGEYCPIIYRPSSLKLLSSVQKWLSPTPDVPSFWPGAGSRRYVLVAVFEYADTGTRFIAANTHLDNESSEARSEGVKIILQVIRDAQAEWGPDLPVTLSGDFNSEPGDDAYQTMVDDGYLGDAYALADEAVRFGPYETYTGFVPDEVPDVSQRIDFIWIGPEAETTWEVNRYEVIDDVVDGVYFSDHRPVFVDVALKN